MAELIKSVKALGEAITGEKIEGDTLFAAVKDAGKKMTGKELKGKELNDIIAETADAYEGGGSGGGSSVIEVPVNSTLTLDGNKLLQLLIAKGVDVDAELTPYSSTGKSGILLGGVIDLNSYLDSSVTTHMIYPYNSSSTAYEATWTLDNYTYGFNVDTTILGNTITFKNMLSNIGEKSMDITSSGIVLIPYLAVTTSSTAPLTPYDITNEEFLSFISIAPLTE